MSECGCNINGTAGSEDVKPVKSARKRYAEKVGIGEFLVREGCTPKRDREIWDLRGECHCF